MLSTSAKRFVIFQTRNTLYNIKEKIQYQYEKYTACMCLSILICMFLVIVVFRSKDVGEETGLPIDSYFAGTEECGKFPCLGKTLCDDIYDGFLKFDLKTPAKKYKSWTIFRGVLVNRHLESRRKNCTIRILESESAKLSADYLDVDRSLQAFRETICQDILGEHKCRVNDTIHDWPVLRRILQSKGILNVELVRGFSPPLKCATQRLVDRIVRRSSSKKHGRMTLLDLPYADKASLLFKLKFAAGSWMQDAFPSNEGWPFGLTYGTCGRIAIHAEMGSIKLAEAQILPWKIRVDLAAQLLDIAFQLSHNDDKYMFLIDKLNLKDFVITVDGKIKIINTDDIIVIDIAESEQVEKHERDECKNLRKDRNVAFVCGILFSKNLKTGLLHDPEETEAFVSLLTALLEVCSENSSTSRGIVEDNVAAAKKVKELLSKIRPCSVDVPYRYPECRYIEGTVEIYHIPWQEVA